MPKKNPVGPCRESVRPGQARPTNVGRIMLIIACIPHDGSSTDSMWGGAKVIALIDGEVKHLPLWVAASYKTLSKCGQGKGTPTDEDENCSTAAT